MARCLIVGCGCRGLMLARALRAEGHVVRGTTRDPARREELEAAGVECVVSDPARMGTLVGALDHAAVAVILLGSAAGSAEEVRTLHGPLLEALLTRITDTTVHGVVYEAAGSVPADVLAGGAAAVQAFGRRTNARTAVLEAHPEPPALWLRDALSAVVTALR